MNTNFLQAPDHGQLALETLTSQGTNSWTSMIRQGATATMEAWTTEEKPNLSWSHPWASAPASAVVWGLFGLRSLAPPLPIVLYPTYFSLPSPTLPHSQACAPSPPASSPYLLLHFKNVPT